MSTLLRNRKEAIKNGWLDRIVQSYPEKTATFLKGQRDQFSNPVGHILTSNVEIIFQKFVEEAELNDCQAALGEIIKVRSVQDCSPSQAISFVYLLRDAIRDEVQDEVEDRRSFEELLRIEDRVTELAGMAFDLYMQSRERIYELRVNEIKRTGFRLLQKANLMAPESRPEVP